MSYIKKLNKEKFDLEAKLTDKLEQLKVIKDTTKWFKLQTEINSLCQSILAKKQRIYYHGKFPYMPDSRNTQIINSLIR